MTEEPRDVAAEREIRLPDSVTALNNLIYEFTSFAEQNGVPLKVRREMHIVFDEVISNIMHHGYEEGAPFDIVVKLKISDDVLETVVIDDARAFNLLDLAPPSSNPHERGIGGLGVHLVRRLMDEVTYSRVEDRNVVTLRRKLAGW